jgi:hypothetical protein
MLPVRLKPARTFLAPAFAYVHVGNAFESADGSALHVDLGVFDDGNILNDLKLQALRRGWAPGGGGSARGISRCR